MSPIIQTLGNASAYGYRSFAAAAVGDFESIATVTVGSGGSASIEFTSIPSTYTHLQIRGLTKDSNSTTQQLRVQLNSDTGNNYAWHYLQGQSPSATAGSSSSTSRISVSYATVLNNVSNTFGVLVFDLLDYANTNKYKTVRALSGAETNTSDGYIVLTSGLWQNTNAVTSIKFYLTGADFAQYSTLALYGIKSS